MAARRGGERGGREQVHAAGAGGGASADLDAELRAAIDGDVLAGDAMGGTAGPASAGGGGGARAPLHAAHAAKAGTPALTQSMVTTQFDGDRCRRGEPARRPGRPRPQAAQARWSSGSTSCATRATTSSAARAPRRRACSRARPRRSVARGALDKLGGAGAARRAVRRRARRVARPRQDRAKPSPPPGDHGFVVVDPPVVKFAEYAVGGVYEAPLLVRNATRVLAPRAAAAAGRRSSSASRA